MRARWRGGAASAAGAARQAVAAAIRGGALAMALAAPAWAETLTDALIGAYRTSGLLQQNRALLRVADEDVAIAVSALYPVLNWTLQSDYLISTAQGAGSARVDPLTGLLTQTPGRRETTTDLTATLALVGQITLYDGGQNRLAIDAAKQAVLATRASLRDVEQQVLLRAVVAFFGVLRDEEFVTLRQNNVRLISEELRAAQDRFEVGEITRTDVSLAEAALAEARSFLASAEGELTTSREEYLAVVGRYPGDLVEPTSPMRPAASVEAARTVAVRRHPSILEAQRNVTVSEINIERAYAERRPSLTLGGRLSGRVTEGGGPVDRADSLTLEFGGPIYQGGRLDALYRQAVARTEASRAVLLVTVEQVRQDVANAFMNLNVAQATLESSRRQVEAQQTAFEGTREEATLGARTTLDVLNAEQDLLNARTNIVAASTNQFVAAYQLLSAMGLLTAEALELGIVQYDPEAYYDAVREAPLVSPRGRRLDAVLKSLGQN